MQAKTGDHAMTGRSGSRLLVSLLVSDEGGQERGSCWAEERGSCWAGDRALGFPCWTEVYSKCYELDVFVGGAIVIIAIRKTGVGATKKNDFWHAHFDGRF